VASQQTLLPTGALLLAGTLSLPLAAQTTPAPTDPSTVAAPQTVTVTGHLGDKDTLRATDSTIGKGRQNLRDIPQSVTVLTEKLMDDRNLETVKEALKMTAGISFLAAEGGEEDVRLRGFSLQATGDVFVDGIRDPAFYERDTFNLERLEVMRGSASMLFGRGSTGGAVNQVSKTPRLLDENQVDVTLGSHAYRRVVGDINRRTGPSAALRLTAMHTQAQDNGTGTAVDKSGLAAAYRFGIGERNEFSASVYALDNRNGMNYGLPWIRPTPTSSALESTVLPLDPATYFGMASDRNHGSARLATVSHLHRFDDRSELKTVVRAGRFTRDQRASAIRLGNAALQGGVAASLATFGPQTVLTRGTNLKIQDLDTLHAQSDFSRRFQGLGLTHELLAGVDAAVEDKTVYAARTAAQGGVAPVKPNTLAGTPSDGATVNEDTRALRVNNQYRAKGAGAYLQDLITLAPHWKVLAGLRYDRLVGDYQTYGNPPNAVDNGPLSAYRMTVGEWSKRAGLLYQPSERHAFHASAATSFNTSGDAYSLGASNVDTPPEQSLNLEVGGRIDSADKRFTTRLALFRSIKMNERNTDPLLPVVTLSGRRHVGGVEVDVAGKLAPGWEVFGSFTWLPDARVDRAAPCPTTGACSQGAPGEREGDRPALTPRYSGTLWTTWQATSAWRVGGGLNFRGRQTPTRAEFEVPAFVTADLMVEFAQSEQLRWKLNVSNVGNTLYADQLYPGHYVPGAGRLWQLTGSYQF
jgi:catecholate siderophore receptor